MNDSRRYYHAHFDPQAFTQLKTALGVHLTATDHAAVLNQVTATALGLAGHPRFSRAAVELTYHLVPVITGLPSAAAAHQLIDTIGGYLGQFVCTHPDQTLRYLTQKRQITCLVDTLRLAVVTVTLRQLHRNLQQNPTWTGQTAGALLDAAHRLAVTAGLQLIGTDEMVVATALEDVLPLLDAVVRTWRAHSAQPPAVVQRLAAFAQFGQTPTL